MELLQAILERALAVVGSARSIKRELHFQIMALRDSPETALNELRELFAAVESNEELCAFGVSGDEGFHSLIYWLLSRSQQVGAKQAIEDLAWYLEASFVDASFILGLDGIRVVEPMKFGDFELVAWGDLELSDTKWNVASSCLSGRKLPSAVLVRRYRVDKSTIPPYLGLEHALLSAVEPAQDLLRCIALVSGAGIRQLHFGVQPEARAPLTVGLTYFGIDSSKFSNIVDVTQVSQLEIEHCFEALEKLENSRKIRLRLPLDRLNKSFLSAFDQVASAIELGIALESMFAPVKLSEGISYAIRTRAAKWLGGTLDQRKQIMEALKNVYDLRSLAIHAGRFDTEGAKKAWRDFEKVSAALGTGRRIVAESLVKVLLEGEPNWEDFDLAST
ncbi:MAG: hypothetical protein ACKVOO_09415 [Burkholderiaceae bacterium]